MKLICTPSDESYSFLILDTETGQETRIESHKDEGDDGADATRNRHRPFGISWDDDFIYVPNRRSINVFDKNYKFLDKIENVLCQNPHTCCMVGVFLITACTSHDSIAATHVDNGKTFYLNVNTMEVSDTLKGEDTRHINSIVYKNGLLFILSNNRKKRYSSVICLQISEYGFIKRYEINLANTYQAHGLSVGNGFACLDTGGDRNIEFLFPRRTIDIFVDEGCFLRGMVDTGKFLCYAYSDRQERSNRSIGDSFVEIVDKKTGEKLQSIQVKDIGAINEIRAIDQFDYCHHNKLL